MPEDITAIWKQVEELKKKIFGFSDRDKWNFGDALCWYDLNKQYKMSFGKIALLWVKERAPHIRDIESFRITVREGFKRIKRYIARLTPLPIVRDSSEITEE
ncbi:MAG: hypothetical protein E4G89_04710 [Methanothrix sp.]|nr:MAG: hypothetical protein E4G89_04710 [Methanothrix sp.]